MGRNASLAPAGPHTFLLASWVFLRLLGVVYFSAFASLWVQVRGLIGSQGVLPARDFLERIREVTGPERYSHFPTLCWLDTSDSFLEGLCLGGMGLAVLLLLGIVPMLDLSFLWVLYLSLSVAGQIFLGYQWDALLLETGLLAIFLSPLRAWPSLRRERPPSRIILWLFRWLLFRLMFASGLVKLLSGDETWRSLTALRYHYETQPLPTWTSWYMQQLPDWLQSLSVLMTFLAELLVPLLIFGPRICRHIACMMLLTFQVLIAATGNYGFFNLLSAALCLLLLDDDVFPARFRRWLPRPSPPRARPGWLAMVAGATLFALTLMPALEHWDLRWPGFLVKLQSSLASLRSFNSYGLFAVMTQKRPEITVEGSMDGETWRPYEFRWKPGEVGRRPRFTGLHMPRLDWQMWFAALGTYRQSPWFGNFAARLLQSSPTVLGLLEHNPFPEAPPRFIRAIVYDYHFTDWRTRRETGAWWRRGLVGVYLPPVFLGSGQE
jgi:hypothetical protein